MGNYLEKKEVKKALKEAKRLAKEPEPIPTKQKELAIQKEVASFSEKLKKLLRPSWFVRDVHRKTKKKKAKKKKPKKKTKKKRAKKKIKAVRKSPKKKAVKKKKK